SSYVCSSDLWLGWLNSASAADVADYEDFAHRVKGQNFTDAVVLGMGGSSLGPEVLAETFSNRPGFPKLHVLDSTDPAQVRSLEASIDLAKTLFIVSSKSGGTTDPNVMKDYFFARVSKAIGDDTAGVQLGLAMGRAGLEGRDKVTILSSRKVADFGAWAEQLIAESTGKDGKGLIPINGEPLGEPAMYRDDRFFVDIRTEGDSD